MLTFPETAGPAEVPAGPADGAAVTLDGLGLHGGLPASVTLAKTAHLLPITFQTAAFACPLHELEIVRADQGVRLRGRGVDVDGVEHLLAAFGGLGIRSGVAVTVSGGELPLMDGAALAFSRALSTLHIARADAALVIKKTGTIRVGRAIYAFAPGRTTLVDVEVDFAPTAIGVERARWHGDPEGFVCDFAWARTFGFRRDAEPLRARGRARGVDPRSVMVLDDVGRVEAPGAPARPGEFARHKLLDLIGDLFLFGGPPVGQTRSHRPGHAATHRAMLEALDRGIVVKG